MTLFVSAVAVLAGSATWNLNPTDAKWNNPLNWTPQTVPSTFRDVATFDVSNVTRIRMTDNASLDSAVFNSGAGAFTIVVGRFFSFRGAGILNNSGVTQTFDDYPDPYGSYNMTFNSGASIDHNVVINLKNEQLTYGAEAAFFDHSSAGYATINVAGALTPLGTYQARLFLYDRFHAGHAHFNINGGQIGDGVGGTVEFDCDSPCSGENATFVANGATVDRAVGGEVFFGYTSTAGDATLIANGGANGGGGGRIEFSGNSTGGNARVELFDSGLLDLEFHEIPGATVGSIEGNGVVVLADRTLTVGSNNRDTIFDGPIKDGTPRRGGSLTKIGSGKLVLTHANTYSGSTTVEDGTLLIDNTIDSATGRGPVLVEAGRLGGDGTVSGVVTIGAGNGAGAFLSPGRNHLAIATLTVQSELSFKSDGVYEFALDSDRGVADEVIANGVTIDGSAQLDVMSVGTAVLAPGTVFTVINNAAATAIGGTFGNLADGATVTTGPNTFQANYEGGDGNDLTLTVIL
jgi:autotransporter-associated beta strand protein